MHSLLSSTSALLFVACCTARIANRNSASTVRDIPDDHNDALNAANQYGNSDDELFDEIMASQRSRRRISYKNETIMDVPVEDIIQKLSEELKSRLSGPIDTTGRTDRSPAAYRSALDSILIKLETVAEDLVKLFGVWLAAVDADNKQEADNALGKVVVIINKIGNDMGMSFEPTRAEIIRNIAPSTGTAVSGPQSAGNPNAERFVRMLTDAAILARRSAAANPKPSLI